MIRKMKEFWRRWFGKKNEPVSECLLATTVSDATEGNKTLPTMLQRLEMFLFDRYDFRFNVLVEQAEYRKKGEMHFAQVDQRMLNTFCMEARE